MECVQKQTIEKRIEGQELNLKCLDIDNKKYHLKISNNTGRISLEFCEDKQEDYGDNFTSEYEIVIEKNGIRFKRFVYRPNHDHNDVESLQIIVDEKKSLGKKGELAWRSGFPYSSEGYDFFYIPFGSIRVNY